MATKSIRRPRRLEEATTVATDVSETTVTTGSNDGGVRTDVSGGGLMLKPHAYNLTLPPPDDFYFVREDQLDSLERGARDWSLEISLAAAGGAIGFAQNLISAIGAVANGKPVSTLDFLLAFAALGLAVLAITKGLQAKRNINEVSQLIGKIKSGQKASVT